MKRFLAVVALFLVPVLLVCGVFGLAVYSSGEWRTEEEVAQMVLDGQQMCIRDRLPAGQPPQGQKPQFFTHNIPPRFF